MFAKIDRWIGSRLFVPLIIKLCQRIGMSQWAFHQYTWMLVSWLWLVRDLRDGDSIWISMLIATYLTSKAALIPEHQGHSLLWFRYLMIVGSVVHAICHATGVPILFADPNWGATCPNTILLLAAEYALTIKTIPPTEVEKSEAQTKSSSSTA